MSEAEKIWERVFSGQVSEAIEFTNARRSSGSDEYSQQKKIEHRAALYVEPSLNSPSGHQLSLALCYEELLHRLGFETWVAHAMGCTLSTSERWFGYFLVPHHTLSFRPIESTQQLNRVEAYFLSEFKQLIDSCDPQLCVFATIRFTNVAAAALASAQQGQDCKIIFGVMEAEQVPDCKCPDIVRGSFSRAAEILHRSGTPCQLIAETVYVRDFLLSCGFREKDVKVYPYVAAKKINRGTGNLERRSSDIHIGYAGGSRPVRHPEVVVDLLVEEPLSDSFRWSVQFDLSYLRRVRDDNTVLTIQKLHDRGLIDLLPTGLTDVDYRNFFRSLDFILMPYSNRYHQIGSGILLEAIYAGVIPVMPRNSSMHRLYASLGGLAPVFDSLSTKAIIGAISDAVHRHVELKESAISVRNRWRQHPSSAEQWESEMKARLHNPVD